MIDKGADTRFILNTVILLL